MDIDTIISELNEVVRYKGQGGLVDAVARAPKLLKQPRYQQADDPRDLLAKDVKVAISRLPRDVQTRANGLLPIDEPDEYIAGRLQRLGMGKASSPAKSWYRTAALGRVATELLKICDEQPSYRILALDIQVRDELSGRDFGGTDHIRTICFTWTIECLISDFRSFAFSHHTPKSLKFIEFAPSADRRAGVSGVRFADTDRADSHWYVIFLTDCLPTGVPVKLKAAISYKANKAPPQFEYIPSVPMRSLAISLGTLRADTQHTCIALDETDKPLKEYGARTDIEIINDDGILRQPAMSRFRIRSPRVGRRYRVTWPKKG